VSEDPQSSRDAISDLVRRYSDAVNRRDPAVWSGTFAPDASWRLGPERVVEGRAEILRLWTREMQKFRRVVQIVGDGSVVLDSGGRTGTGRWEFQEHAEREDGASSFMVAHYEDEYLQVDGQWFFANRSLVPHHRRVSETRAEEAEAPASGSSGPEAPVSPVGQNGD